ncbi:MAG: hypothetical protein ABI573_02620 [Chloroflexota bacterium]
MHRQRKVQLVGMAIVVAALAGVLFVGSRWNGVIPAATGSSILARTVMTGENGPDGTRTVDGGPTPQGQDCREITDNPAGKMYACWETYRDPNDGDPDKDYFHLYAHGSFGGETGTGANWLVVRADLVGAVADGAYANWPDSTYGGACEEVAVSIPILLPLTRETVCGTTTGSLDARTWTQTLTWTCEACPFGNHVTRGFAMYGLVGVPEGTVPAWDISIDYGS